MHIGVSGQCQNGKDTLSDYLCDILNKRIKEEIITDLQKFATGTSEKTHFTPHITYVRAAFAQGVKDVFCNAFGKSRDFIEEWKVKSEIPEGMDMSVRKSLQFIGNGFRQIKGDIWLERLFKDKVPNKVISDCRYVNELQRVRIEGGLNILIWRPGFENDDTCDSEAQARSLVDWFIDQGVEGDVRELSSQEVAGTELVDIFIKNNNTIEDLYSKIDNLIIPMVMNV